MMKAGGAKYDLGNIYSFPNRNWMVVYFEDLPLLPPRNLAGVYSEWPLKAALSLIATNYDEK